MFYEGNIDTNETYLPENPEKTYRPSAFKNSIWYKQTNFNFNFIQRPKTSLFLFEILKLSCNSYKLNLSRVLDGLYVLGKQNWKY